jgi:hypothetical protein
VEIPDQLVPEEVGLARTDQSANMVANTSYHAEDGKPALGPDWWFGIQDGGASSILCGHETLMNIID